MFLFASPLPLYFLKPQICLLFHSLNQWVESGHRGGFVFLLTPVTSAAFIAVSVLGGAGLIRERNSRVRECRVVTETLSCHCAGVAEWKLPENKASF